MLVKAKWCSVWLLALMLAGCEARLQDHRTVEVDPAGEMVIPLDAQSRERTLQVTAKAEGGPIDIYVYLSKDDQQAVADIYAKRDGLFLAREVNVTQANLSAVIPANEQATVLLTCASNKPATVELTLED